MFVTKKELRRRLLAKRKRLTVNKALVGAVAVNLLSLLDELRPVSVGGYYPIMGEPDYVDIMKLWCRKKSTMLTFPETEVAGIQYRIWHEGVNWAKDEAGVLYPDGPVLGEAPAVILVPCLGHDNRGRRLGYGKGFFDRYLSCTETISVGLSFEALEVPANIFELHDEPMRYLVTEKRIYRFANFLTA